MDSVLRQQHRMAKDGKRGPEVRIRAPKACRRCSQRKVKCDGAETGLPCSRCRSEGTDECAFPNSRRGTYSRKPSHRQSRDASSFLERKPSYASSDRSHQTLENPSQLIISRMDTDNNVHSPILDCSSGIQVSGSNAGSCFSDGTLPTIRDRSSVPYSTAPKSSSTSVGCETEPSISAGDIVPSRSSTTRGAKSQSSTTSSLASMFEDFLNRQGIHNDGVVEKCGIVFLGGPSHMTTALEELRKGTLSDLHDVGVDMSKQSMGEEGIAGPAQSTHPSHLSSQDIAYLRSKGAFDFPEACVLHSLVEAFLTRFYPLYSIVNKEEFMDLYGKQKLPWILLHTVCFVGATFCDLSVIYNAGFKKRWHTRRLFYDRAKVLFEVGYETNKIVLLQTVLMLTFWGPQMKSYWNPCSWVGFAVTIAESLGIHRLRISARMSPKDKGLLRRLWWTLALRDASCAALLGRPFRINIAQCDTDMLEMDDFSTELCGSIPDTDDEHVQGQAMYQIHIVKLSLILRSIIQCRYGPTESSTKTVELQRRLVDWQLELPKAVNWEFQHEQLSVFAISLRIVFHHHLILLYLDKPSQGLTLSEEHVSAEKPSSEAAALAANMISSTALSLMTRGIVSQMPHETFPGFSIAGIVFYRQIQQQQGLLKGLGRAALDNCQMVINEARDHWDAAQWMMRIFDFLFSSAQKTEVLDTGAQPTKASTPALIDYDQVDGSENFVSELPDTRFYGNNDMIHSVDWESPQFQSGSAPFDDFLFMQNFFDQRGNEAFDFPVGST